jgi:hypothetical protein
MAKKPITILCDYSRCGREATKDVMIAGELISVCEKHAEVLGFGSDWDG